MKATGIVRRMDELGRVVIPKELRKTYRLREGDPLEIFTDGNNGIVFKKYSPIVDLESHAKSVVTSIYKSVGGTVCITDTDKVIAAAGGFKRDLENKDLTDEFKIEVYNKSISEVSISIVDELPNLKASIVSPIVVDGDVVGSIAVVTSDNCVVDKKIICMATNFIVSLLEG